MGVGRERRLAHPPQQGAEGGIAREVGAQGQGVDEEAEQPLDPGLRAAGDGRAHHQVGLAGEPAEQRREGRQGGHEQGRSLVPRQAAETRRQLRRQRHRAGGAAEALGRRARPVGRQLQEGGRAAEPLPPEGELRRHHLPGQPAPLPDREVAILEDQLRQRRGAPGGEGAVEGSELALEDDDRPAVEGDVVAEEEEAVLLLPQPQQEGPRHRAVDEVERPPRLPRRQTVRLHPRRHGRQRREVGPGEPGGTERRHDLARLPVRTLGEGGAQGLVAAEHLVQGARQGRLVERAVQPERHRQVVDRRARIEPVEEPEPLLGEGERQRLRAGGLDERRPRRELRPRPQPLLDPPRHRSQGARLEGGAQGEVDSEGRAHPRQHLADQQGVAAEVEEVVAGARPRPRPAPLPRSPPAAPRPDCGAPPPARPPRSPAAARAGSAPCGPPCRWGSGGARGSPRSTRAPCTPAAARRGRRGARRRTAPPPRPEPDRPPAACLRGRPRAPPPPPRGSGGGRAAPPRSPPARRGSRAPSPGGRCAPGTRCGRPAGSAPRSLVR